MIRNIMIFASVVLVIFGLCVAHDGYFKTILRWIPVAPVLILALFIWGFVDLWCSVEDRFNEQ